VHPDLDYLTVDAGVLTRDECKRVEEAREIRNEMIHVDSFDPAEFLRLR